MKPPEQSYESRVILKTGSTYLAAWSQKFSQLPEEGDDFTFPSHVMRLSQLKRYKGQATVRKVQAGKDNELSFIELEAEPSRSFGRVVRLNSSFIPFTLHMDAERIVRQADPNTRLIWQRGIDPVAILDISEPKDFQAVSPEDAHRSRGETQGVAGPRLSRVTLEAQLRQMLTRSREVLAHF